MSGEVLSQYTLTSPSCHVKGARGKEYSTPYDIRGTIYGERKQTHIHGNHSQSSRLPGLTFSSASRLRVKCTQAAEEVLLDVVPSLVGHGHRGRGVG